MRKIPSVYQVTLYKLLNPTNIRLLILGLLVIAAFASPGASLACDVGGTGSTGCGGGLMG